MSDDPVIRLHELPGGENASTFNGHEHGAPVSIFFNHNRPGTGPALHRQARLSPG